MPQFGKGNKAAKKEGRLSRNTIQRRERELRKKEKEEVGVDDKEGKASAGARKNAAESVAAEDGKAATASASASVEAEVEVKDWSQQKRARQSRTNGSAVRSTGVTARNARARSALRSTQRAAECADRGAEQ